MRTTFSSRGLFLCLGLALSWQLIASIGEAEPITILIGADDQFGSDPEIPAAEPSAELAALIELNGFNVGKSLDDITTNNDNVGHTFTGLPSDIATATLELRMRGIRGGTTGDGILISFVDPGDTLWRDEIEWSATLGPIADASQFGLFEDNQPGLAVQAPDEWSVGDEALITLNLADLRRADGTPVNLIPMINAKGFFDVVSGDDSGTDFYRLTYTRIPEPGTATLAAFACALLACRHRKRR